MPGAQRRVSTSSVRRSARVLQVDSLHSIMLEHMEEDALVLATTAAAARLLAQPATRTALMAHPEVAAHFAELLHQQHMPDVRGALVDEWLRIAWSPLFQW